MFNKDTEVLMPDDEEISYESQLETLPPRAWLVLGAWRSGEDVRKLMSQASWYRYRKMIKDAVGVDIAAVKILPLNVKRQVIDLKDAERPNFYEG